MPKPSTFRGKIALLIHGALLALVLAGLFFPGIPAFSQAQGRQDFTAAPPKRLISLAPSMTEILYFLELGERVVGVTGYCDQPPEVKGKPRVGTYWDFNQEAIPALDRPAAGSRSGDRPAGCAASGAPPTAAPAVL